MDQDTLTGQPQDEEQEQSESQALHAQVENSQPLPDIVTGDMETDLPQAGAESEDKESREAEDQESEEMEIPWGDVKLPEPGAAVVEQEQAQEPAPAEQTSEALLAAQPAGAPVYKHAWYVVHCYSGYENKVKKGLEQRIVSMGMHDRIYRVVVPIEKEVEIKEGQRRNIERRVFPGYILVEMMELEQGEPTSDEAWYVVRNTPGVTGFVSSGDKPVPLREEEVTKILKRMEAAEPKVHVTFRTGQTVHIIDGPFADFHGTVDNVDMTKGKVRVLVSFFGRETPVELDLLQVEKK
ncbi:MAG: transcription termination/antitermination protein NusG [Anaerolineae bacterium]